MDSFAEASKPPLFPSTKTTERGGLVRCTCEISFLSSLFFFFNNLKFDIESLIKLVICD